VLECYAVIGDKGLSVRESNSSSQLGGVFMRPTAATKPRFGSLARNRRFAQVGLLRCQRANWYGADDLEAPISAASFARERRTSRTGLDDRFRACEGQLFTLAEELGSASEAFRQMAATGAAAVGFGTAPAGIGSTVESVVLDDHKRKDEIMGKTVMGAVVSLDGFIADDNDDVGPLFDWYGNGDVTWAFEGADYECRTTQASADFMQSHYRDLAAVVIGRRLFDLTNGWNGKPAAGEHVFVVTHRPPTDWEHADTAPFTFVDGVEKAIAAAKEFAGDRVVDVAAGQIGSQALKLGLIDQVVVNQVPVVFGSGRPFFATGGLAEPLRLENPTTIVPGDRVTHLVYDISR
jgi:dihydrofolate reductase